MQGLADYLSSLDCWDNYMIVLCKNNTHVICRLTCINPLHPNIIMHILHTVPYTFSKVLMLRICFIIQSFSRG